MDICLSPNVHFCIFFFFRLLHDLFDSDGANVSAKKRKSDKPKKHLGSTVETIVPKKPKNLFMNCLQQIQSTAGSATTTTTTSTVTTSGSSAPGAKRPLPPPVVAPSPADEYEFNEDDDFQLPTLGKHRYLRNSMDLSVFLCTFLEDSV